MALKYRRCLMFKKGAMLALTFALITPLVVYSQELWTAKDGSIRNIDTRALLVTGTRMYLATKNELYASSGSSGKCLNGKI